MAMTARRAASGRAKNDGGSLRCRQRLDEAFFERSPEDDAEDDGPDRHVPAFEHESEHAHREHDADVEVAARDRVGPEHAEQHDDRQQRVARHTNKGAARANRKEARRQQREVGEHEHQVEAVDEAGLLSKISGPGCRFFIIMMPRTMAVIESPGMPSVSAGTHAPASAELFAAPASATPSSDPRPYSSGLDELRFEIPYETHAAMSAPAPGRMPMRVPMALA